MISTLIALVLSLLVQVQQPNVPVQLKIQGLEIANQILLLAQTEQNGQQTATTTETSAISEPVSASSTQPKETPVLAPTSAGIEAPTCTLEAQAVAVTGLGWRVQFTWQYTQGAYATISSNGQVIAYPNKGTTFNNSTLAGQPLYYYIFGPTDYEMDVSLDGLTGSCTASAAIPTSN